MVPLNAAKTRIRALNLEGVKADLIKAHGYSKPKAETAVSMYRAFLEMVAEFPDVNMAPPRIVDEAWHMHILDTRRYHADCQAVFGRYLHHDPDAFGTRVFDASWDFTRALYQDRLGVSLVAQGEEAQEQVTRATAMDDAVAVRTQGGTPSAVMHADLEAVTCFVADKADLEAVTCFVADKADLEAVTCFVADKADLEAVTCFVADKTDLEAVTCFVADKADLEAVTCFVADKTDLEAVTCFVADKTDLEAVTCFVADKTDLEAVTCFVADKTDLEAVTCFVADKTDLEAVTCFVADKTDLEAVTCFVADEPKRVDRPQPEEVV